MNSTHADRLPYVPWACYLLSLAVWVLDLLTPQAFVAAILMNGPIALSSIVLRRDLTIRLVVLAELANLIAGYVNGVQSHYHWDGVAIGDRVLLAASYLLVGYMTAQTQVFARAAGAASLRSLQMRNEQALRRANDRVRASLSPDLVLRAIPREALQLFNAQSALLFSRPSLLMSPEVFRAERTGTEITVGREPLPVAAASVLNRLSDEAPTQCVRSDDAAGRLLLEQWRVRSVLVARLPWTPGEETLLFILPDSQSDVDDDEFDMFNAFTQQAAVALSQSALFERLARQNEEIADRNRVIRDIVYALAHDLRTPLSAANTTMKQALAGAYGALPEAYQKIVRTTILSNDELRHLAETLLMVARYELGDVSQVRERVEVSALCAAIQLEMAPVALEKNITFTLDDGANAAAVTMGDPSELRRAILNLVANALSATPQDGHVRIILHVDDRSIEIRIEDDGYGVPEARRQSLFEPFGVSGVAVGGGTGLGLNIVRRIVEKHRGTVTYEPAHPRGSIFSMFLPMEFSP